MSTVLFVNTNRIIDKQGLSKIQKWIYYVHKWSERYVGKESFFYCDDDIKEPFGKNYVFDFGDWVPFRFPLQSYKGNVDKRTFRQFTKITKTIVKSVRLLLKNGYSVKLCIGTNYNPPPLNKNVQRLKLADLNENRELEWLTVYEMVE